MNVTDALRLSGSSGKPVIALTGAGGKSSLLFRLGMELAADGRPTVLTCSTQLAAHQASTTPAAMATTDGGLIDQELPGLLRDHHLALVHAGPAREAGKLQGLTPDAICRLAALPDVEAVVVEADGSRARPLKAPAAHEPVVPSCASHVVTVMGMAALGKPLGGDWVHRPELAAGLMGLAPGDAITPAAMAALATHAGGGLKGHEPQHHSLLFLNLAGDSRPDTAAAARQIARLVLHAPATESGIRYQAVLIGSPQEESPVREVVGRVVGVILAAGRSSRLEGDQPKQLLPWPDGNTVISHAADTALAAQNLSEVMVVTGYRAEEVRAALGRRPLRVVHNPDFASGQASSVRAAVQALPGDTAAACFLLADQPTVTRAAIDALAATHNRTLAPVVPAVYHGGARGNPVLFDRSVFAELMALEGDSGGRPLIQKYVHALQTVAIDAPQPEGVDTWEDYRRLLAQAASRE